MATVTESVAASTKAAWAEYAERLQGLEGAEYDRAEAEAWDELQATLEELQASTSPTDHPIG